MTSREWRKYEIAALVPSLALFWFAMVTAFFDGTPWALVCGEAGLMLLALLFKVLGAWARELEDRADRAARALLRADAPPSHSPSISCNPWYRP